MGNSSSKLYFFFPFKKKAVTVYTPKEELLLD
jgi:hypothetical protein